MKDNSCTNYVIIFGGINGILSKISKLKINEKNIRRLKK